MDILSAGKGGGVTMRVLLHTPLKSPDSPIPSGDREMARGCRRLLRRLGHHVGDAGDEPRPSGRARAADHLALERRARAKRTADRALARLPARHPERFDLWLTYHCYYRKPDWLGPIVTRALAYPMRCAEARTASRRAQGRRGSAIAPSSAPSPPPTWC
jgi:hypothetical protein